MRDVLKRLLRMIVGYGAIQWAGPLISFLFTPIITRLLTPGDYGVADYVLTIASAVGTLALFAMPQAVAAHFNDRPDPVWQASLSASALTLGCLIGIPIGLGLALFAPWAAQASFGNTNHAALFQAVGLSVAFAVCSAVLVAAAQAALRVRWGMIFSLTSLLAGITGNVLFIIVLRLGPMGLVLADVLTGVVVSMVALWIMRGMLGRPSLALIGKLARSGGVLMPTAISAWILLVADRLFLVHYVSVDALGQYAIANKIASMAYVALAPMYTAWTSLGLSFQSVPDARSRYASLARYLIAVVLMVTLGLGLFATEILIVLTRPAYVPAARYVGLLTYMQVFGGFGTALYISALAAKQLAAISWTVAAGALVNIVLNFWLIPPYGVWGACIATVVGYGVPQVLLYFVLQRSYPVPYSMGRLLAATGVQSGLMAMGLLVPPLAFPLRVGLKVVLLACMPAALLLFHVVTPLELRQAGLALNHRLRLGLESLRR